MDTLRKLALTLILFACPASGSAHDPALHTETPPEMPSLTVAPAPGFNTTSSNGKLADVPAGIQSELKQALSDRVSDPSSHLNYTFDYWWRAPPENFVVCGYAGSQLFVGVFQASGLIAADVIKPDREAFYLDMCRKESSR